MWNPTPFRTIREKEWGTVGPSLLGSLLSACGNLRSAAGLVIFLIEKLRPRLWAISRSSRKYHDFSQ